MSDKSRLMYVYDALYEAFGPQNWWPGETQLEVIVGAVLTQNTSWKNVERAIMQMKRNGLLSLETLNVLGMEKLAELIRPSGYYNIKADRLREVVRFLSENGGIEVLSTRDTKGLRKDLLNIKGVGEETADSVLLYAFERPVFVVDAYTRRIFSRLGMLSERSRYSEIQRFFQDSLTESVKLFNEYHALIVRHGKEICRAKNPKCGECPLGEICEYKRGLIKIKS